MRSFKHASNERGGLPRLHQAPPPTALVIRRAFSKKGPVNGSR